MNRQKLYKKIKSKIKRQFTKIKSASPNRSSEETTCYYQISYVGIDCDKEGYTALLKRDILHGRVTGIQGKGKKYQEDYRYNNDVPHILLANRFEKKGYDFYGWHMQKQMETQTETKTETQEIWYCTDGSWHTNVEIKNNLYKKYCFSDEESISLLPLHSGDKLTLIAQWRKNQIYGTETDHKEQYYLYYNGNGDDGEKYSQWIQEGLIRGYVSVTPKKAHEFKESYLLKNHENTILLKNGFSKNGYTFIGWQARKQCDNIWKWYCIDGTWRVAKELENNPALRKYCFSDKEAIGYLPMKDGDKVIMSAVWEEN